MQCLWSLVWREKQLCYGFMMGSTQTVRKYPAFTGGPSDDESFAGVTRTVAKRVWPNSPAFSIWPAGRCFPTGSIISPGANSCQLPSAAGPSRTTPGPAGRAGGNRTIAQIRLQCLCSNNFLISVVNVWVRTLTVCDCQSASSRCASTEEDCGMQVVHRSGCGIGLDTVLTACCCETHFAQCPSQS